VAFIDDHTVARSRLDRPLHPALRVVSVACVTGLILPLELETESQLLLEQFAGFGKGFEPRTYPARAGQRCPRVSIRAGHDRLRRQHDLASFRRPRAAEQHRVGDLLASEGSNPLSGAGTLALGGEDLDLYMRLLLGGQAIAYEPSAIVWHEHPNGPQRLRSQVYRYGVGLGATFAKQLFRGPARR
jgi:hypothetical protein